MILLFDIGNTHTHVGLADENRVARQTNVPTREWFGGKAGSLVKKFASKNKIAGAILCSVVPRATPFVKKFVRTNWNFNALELNSKTVHGIGIDYPKPKSIGADRLVNAMAAKFYFGAPVVVVDFGTAVTFDVVNVKGNYVGGIIAPGLAAMTDYLHEKTALLPRIEIREIKSVVGKSTEQAMLIGAVHGYRGLIRELIGELKRELRAENLPVVATGGYAKLIAAKLPEVFAVRNDLTLEGLRLVRQSYLEQKTMKKTKN
ncbi:MAG TPA: type III pantothenate kinase [Verrucomicrobiae bacterium]|nr:type III pantothenate kinase [Verrucomicrobiae bacterium]